MIVLDKKRRNSLMKCLIIKMVFVLSVTVLSCGSDDNGKPNFLLEEADEVTSEDYEIYAYWVFCDVCILPVWFSALLGR